MSLKPTNRKMFATLLKALVVASVFMVMGSVAAAQVALSEVEVRLVRRPTGGCVDPCPVNYRVTIRGDGAVEYEGTGLVEGVRKRSISPDEVVSLVNEFLRARFFNLLDTYRACCSFVVRNGDTVAVYGKTSADEPRTDLTLRIGTRTKTVTLAYPHRLRVQHLSETGRRSASPRSQDRRLSSITGHVEISEKRSDISVGSNRDVGDDVGS
jgi:hypothetical protein